MKDSPFIQTQHAFHKKFRANSKKKEINKNYSNALEVRLQQRPFTMAESARSRNSSQIPSISGKKNGKEQSFFTAVEDDQLETPVADIKKNRINKQNKSDDFEGLVNLPPLQQRPFKSNVESLK